MTDIVKRLKYGLIEYPKRWSGDTHSDLGGSVDYEANDVLMNEAADRIEALEAQLAKADALAAWAKAISERKPSPATGGRMILERDIVGLETALDEYRAAREKE